MGSIRKTMASMLAVLALTAFMSDAGAQTRRSSDVKKSTPARQSTTRSSSSSRERRPASSSQARKSNDNKKPAVRPSSGPDRRPSTTVARPSNQTARPAARPETRPATRQEAKPATRPAAKPDKQSSGNRTDFKPGDQNKPVQISRPTSGRSHGNNKGNRPGVRPDSGPGKKPVHVRPDHRHDPPRVHPRDRDFMRWDRPSYWWSHNHHYYGYRVRVLPTHVVRHLYHGITYYCYNDIWYRPYGGYYIVCRPPHGISLAADIISDIAWTAIRLSYYNTVANAYSQINENNAYIAEQNAIIAQNNATIAAQNATIAQNQQLAQTAYTLANSLGLIQSYAAADSEYFYQDGVFYAKDAAGEYKVILPPAGALVETLPEDFDMVTLSDGNEYYKVDDTIYKVTVSDGKPYFEVVGQQYS